MTSLVLDDAAIDVQAVLAELRATGYARLGRVLSDEGIEALRGRADDIMLGRVSHEGLFFQHDSVTGKYEDLVRRQGFVGPSLQYRKIEKLEKDPLFRAYIGNGIFERILRELAPGPITLYRAVLFNKAARGGTDLPWHQDGGIFWGLDRPPLVQIWTTLDDATEASGCVEVIPGSHLKGLVTPLGGVVQPEYVAAASVDEHRIFVPARAGEALLINNELWHRSGTNRTDVPRRALTVCYLRGETRCVRTKRKPRVFERIF
ncbi:MAG: phytanoyl-CoA dioxygenase family protein [Polyangiaceae bacterium]|nr:phytanoyl-CoA dioxygenase family protein [Polyangiaceae bacterium]